MNEERLIKVGANSLVFNTSSNSHSLECQLCQDGAPRSVSTGIGRCHPRIRPEILIEWRIEYGICNPCLT